MGSVEVKTRERLPPCIGFCIEIAIRADEPARIARSVGSLPADLELAASCRGLYNWKKHRFGAAEVPMPTSRATFSYRAGALAVCLLAGACGGRELIESPGSGGNATGGSAGDPGGSRAGDGGSSSNTSDAGSANASCDERRRTYAIFRDQLLAKHNTTVCGACTLVFEDNNCVANCGTAIIGKDAPSCLEAVRAFAESTCGGCPPPFPPPCPALASRCTASGIGCEISP